MFHFRLGDNTIGKIVSEVCSVLYAQLQAEYMKVTIAYIHTTSNNEPKCFFLVTFHTSWYTKIMSMTFIVCCCLAWQVGFLYLVIFHERTKSPKKELIYVVHCYACNFCVIAYLFISKIPTKFLRHNRATCMQRWCNLPVNLTKFLNFSNQFSCGGGELYFSM